MNFFTSSNDLEKWVKSHSNADEASMNIMEVVGKENEQDIVGICKAIFEDNSDASKVLFGILSKYNISKISEAKMKDKMIKQAQMMRQDSVYGNMEMKFCPKLPKQSAGQGLISTYNCRHYCLDGLVFDDDPNRVYCAEALWRRHVMDKFSREFKDKNGKWVGGYINDRFQVFTDDGGNQMQLANGERTRKPRPHQYSTERRLEEARGEKTVDITASSQQMVKLASVESNIKDDDIYKIFDDIIEMKQANISDEDIIYKVAEHYDRSIINVASIYKTAIKMMQSHNGMVYSHNNVRNIKTSQLIDISDASTLVTKKDIEITTLKDGQKRTLKIETPVVVVSNKNGDITMEIVDGEDAGERFKLDNALDFNNAFDVVEDIQGDKIQEAANEIGLNDEYTPIQPDDFPIEEK